MKELIKNLDDIEIASLVARNEAISLFCTMDSTAIIPPIRSGCICDFLVRGYRVKVDVDCKNCRRGGKFSDGSFKCSTLESFTNLVNSIDVLADEAEQFYSDYIRGK